MLDGGRVVEQGTHDELTAPQRAVPRRCCPGSRRRRCAQAGDRIEALAAAHPRRRDRIRLAGHGANAGPASSRAGRFGCARLRARRRRRRRERGDRRAAADAGTAGPGRRAATGPRRRRRSTCLPRARTAREFSLPALLREFRRPLLHRARARRPRRARRDRRAVPGQDRRRQRRRDRIAVGVLFAASAIFLVVTLADLARRCRVGLRHRPHRRADHALAADPDLGAAAAALAGLLRARAGRPDHDPDDDRRRPVRVAGRERVALRAGRVRDLLRRRRHAAGRRLGTRAA